MSRVAALLQARYGQAEAVPGLDLNPVLETLFAHRSVRAFRPDPLPDGTLETLIAAAQSAPSSSNLQTWSVIAVQSPAGRARLAELTGPQPHVAEAPLVLAWLADLSRISRIAERRGETAAGLDYLDTFLMAVIDAALAAQNAVVAAESLGLGTVYLGALRNQPEAVADLLGVPDGVFPVFGLVVGHPDPARLAQIKPRLPLRTVLHAERYRPVDPQVAESRVAESHVAEPRLHDPGARSAGSAGSAVTSSDSAQELGNYDAVLRRFQLSEGLATVDWSAQVLERLRDGQALKGRDRLYEALHLRGFRFRDVVGSEGQSRAAGRRP